MYTFWQKLLKKNDKWGIMRWKKKGKGENGYDGKDRSGDQIPLLRKRRVQAGDVAKRTGGKMVDGWGTNSVPFSV